jgi:hypothetical protein
MNSEQILQESVGLGKSKRKLDRARADFVDFESQ